MYFILNLTAALEARRLWHVAGKGEIRDEENILIEKRAVKE